MLSAETGAISEAAATFGWSGVPVQVRIAGQAAWAIAEVRDPDPALAPMARGTDMATQPADGCDIDIAGVVVVGTATMSTVHRASLFAGYCQRAVLIPEGRGVLAVQMAAAVLDQGVVVSGGQGMTKLLEPGAAVPAADGWENSAELILVEQVRVSWDGGTAPGF